MDALQKGVASREFGILLTRQNVNRYKLKLKPTHSCLYSGLMRCQTLNSTLFKSPTQLFSHQTMNLRADRLKLPVRLTELTPSSLFTHYLVQPARSERAGVIHSPALMGKIFYSSIVTPLCLSSSVQGDFSLPAASAASQWRVIERSHLRRREKTQQALFFLFWVYFCNQTEQLDRSLKGKCYRILQKLPVIVSHFQTFFFLLCECVCCFVCVVSQRDNSSSTQPHELLSWMNGGLLAVEIALHVINRLRAPNCRQLTCRDLLMLYLLQCEIRRKNSSDQTCLRLQVGFRSLSDHSIHQTETARPAV